MTNAIDAREFRNALGSFATGVTIVTTCDGEGRDVGLTANSFNSVSLDPPMVLWSLAKTSTSLDVFSNAPHFAVHILAADQEHLSNRFAKKGIDKFAGLPLRRNAAGVPLLGGCTALFQCRTAYRYEGGDHVIFVGEVTAIEHLDKPPLVFHGGRYAIARCKSPSSGALFEGAFSDTNIGHLVTRAYMQLVTPLRRNAELMGLSAPERYMMNVLMADAGHDLATINGIINHTGVQVTPECADTLVQRGFVEREMVEGGVAKFRLTAEGRRVAVELLAAAKAVEADALVSLTEDEQRILCDLLMRLVAGISAKGDQRVVQHMDLMRLAVSRAVTELPGA